MRRLLSMFALLCASGLLSCPLSTQLKGSLPPVGAGPEVLGPSAVDRVVHRLSAYQTGLSALEVEAVAHTIVREAERHDMDREMLLAVLFIESGFNNFARSNVGALGLMQIMPATGALMARQLGIPWGGPRTLLDPVKNVRMGTAYLAKLHSRYGRWDKALSAYNWGPSRIDRRIRQGATLPKRYVHRVYAALESPAF